MKNIHISDIIVEKKVQGRNFTQIKEEIENEYGISRSVQYLNKTYHNHLTNIRKEQYRHILNTVIAEVLVRVEYINVCVSYLGISRYRISKVIENTDLVDLARENLNTMIEEAVKKGLSVEEIAEYTKFQMELPYREFKSLLNVNIPAEISDVGFRTSESIIAEWLIRQSLTG